MIFDMVCNLFFVEHETKCLSIGVLGEKVINCLETIIVFTKLCG